MVFNELSVEQDIMIVTLRHFVAAKLAPNAMAWEEAQMLHRPTLIEMADLGLGGIYVNDDVGGTGLGRFDAVLIFEELSKGCIAHAAFVSIHNMCCRMVDSFGSAAMRQKWLPQMVSLAQIASYCLTEPSSGSDAASLQTTALKTQNGFVLNGTKAFISGAGFSDIYLVMARTGEVGAKGISAFLVEKGTKGLSFGKNERKMGWQAQPTAQVIFDDCLIPHENLLGEIGRGFNYAMAGLDGGRLNIAACSIGGAAAALDMAIKYSKERTQFGKPIAAFQNTAFKLADMATELEASRRLLYHAAKALDAGDTKATKLCAMAKRFVTDSCSKIANDALQIHGGYGYLKDYEVERIVRDLRVHQILEGTNEIMRVIIARELEKES